MTVAPTAPLPNSVTDGRGQPTTTAPRRSSWLPHVRNWRVQNKLIAVLVIPVIAFLVIAGVHIGSSARQSTEFGDFAQEIMIGREVTGLVHDLQTERDHAAGYLALPQNSVRRQQTAEQLAADHAAVNLSALAVATAVEPMRGDARLAAAYRKATRDLGGLDQVRAGTKDRWLRQRAVFEEYTRTITDLMAILPTEYDLSDAPDLARKVQSFSAIATLQEYEAQLRGRLYAVATAGRFDIDDDDTLVDLRAKQNASLAKFRTEADPGDISRFDEVMAAQQVSTTSQLQQLTIERAEGTDVGLDPDTWWQASTEQLDLVEGVERRLLDTAIASANQLHSERGAQTALVTGLIALTVAGALLLSWTVGRSMSLSLRALRTQALDVALYRLPDAIERLRQAPTATPIVDVPTSAVRTSDEIGEVAEAFTEVHRRAVLLAAEQAVMRYNVNSMFINLARRSQSLVERQIELLDRLEATETDPDQLENLFRLDHLATRMRRNDENLLVLASGETMRRRVEPVDLSAVVLAAVAEIEQYVRIRRDVTNTVFVLGHVVPDLVHLLAELLENATMFSPPDSTVTVTGRTGPGGGMIVMIDDSGIGMTEDGFAEANAKVTGTTSIDVAASERMGLVVVGHLAARHRIQVRLSGSAAGVTAEVALPPTLLAPEPPAKSTGRSSEVEPPVIRRSIAAIADNTKANDSATSATGIPVPLALSAQATPGALPAAPLPTRAGAGQAGPGRAGPGRAGAQSPADVPDHEEPRPSLWWTGEIVPPGGVPRPDSQPTAGHTPPAAAALSSGPKAAPGATPQAAAAGAHGAAPQAAAAAGAAPQAQPQPHAARVVSPPAEPVIAGTSTAGLPIRVPLAQLPAGQAGRAPAAANPGRPQTDLDPSQVSAVLSAFYDGVRRAEYDEDVPCPPTVE